MFDLHTTVALYTNKSNLNSNKNNNNEDHIARDKRCARAFFKVQRKETKT